MTTAQEALEFINDILPELEVAVQDHPEGGQVLVGPFPSFAMIFGNKDDVDSYIVSMNADPGLIAFFASSIAQKFPDLIFTQSYCESLETGHFLFGEEAAKEREQHIMMQSLMIAKQREKDAVKKDAGLILPPEKKLRVVK